MSRDRPEKRRLIVDCFCRMNEVAVALTPANHVAVVDLANVPSEIRGFPAHGRPGPLPHSATPATGRSGAPQAVSGPLREWESAS